MTGAPPPDPAVPSGPEQGGAPEVVRPPRKRFILIGLGIGLLLIVLIGLFTSLGANQSGGGAPHAGGPVPSFTRPNVGPSGPSQVSVPADGGGDGTPAVLLFFGAWCSSCHQELPPLAAVVRRQERAGGALSRIRVLGIDSFDNTSTAKSFIHSAGVTFPVASDPRRTSRADPSTSTATPTRCSSRVTARSPRSCRGAVLTPSSLTADERALIPSGR